MNKEELQRIQEKVVETIVDSSFMEDWDWYQGVALYALYQHAQSTSKAVLKSYLENWFDRHIREGLVEKNVNSLSPMLTLSLLDENGKYAELIQQCFDFAVNELPRTSDGGLVHKTRDSENSNQLWADTIFMAVLFMLHHDVPQAMQQFRIHVKHLQSPDSGLFYHAWTSDGNHNFAEALWGRANGWMAVSMVEALCCTKLSNKDRQFLIKTLESQFDSLKACQDENGLWHTLLDERESSYPECSATAALAYAILKAVRMGLVDSRYLSMGLNALDGIIKNIDDEGFLNQVSTGTAVKNTLEEYRKIKLKHESYGQALALMLLDESMLLP